MHVNINRIFLPDKRILNECVNFFPVETICLVFTFIRKWSKYLKRRTYCPISVEQAKKKKKYYKYFE